MSGLKVGVALTLASRVTGVVSIMGILSSPGYIDLNCRRSRGLGRWGV